MLILLTGRGRKSCSKSFCKILWSNVLCPRLPYLACSSWLCYLFKHGPDLSSSRTNTQTPQRPPVRLPLEALQDTMSPSFGRSGLLSPSFRGNVHTLLSPCDILHFDISLADSPYGFTYTLLCIFKLLHFA